MASRFYILFVALGLLAACSDSLHEVVGEEAVQFAVGEAVQFSTHVTRTTTAAETRSYALDTETLNAYRPIADDYTLSVTMYEQGVGDPLGTCTYRPVTSIHNDNGYDEDGALQSTPTEGEETLRWYSSQKRYAFSATAGSTTLATDQSTREKWFAQDRVEGYAYVPLLDDATGEPQAIDNLNALNYHTNREWGEYNKQWLDLDNAQVMHSTEHYKLVPLFLQHQRAWITFVLRAGNGISRDALKFETAQKNASVTLYSYDAEGKATPIEKTWPQPAFVDYSADRNGPAQNNVETTCFNVIVEPHNYSGDNVLKDKIAAISLSGLKFSFFAGNDENYQPSIVSLGEDATEDDKAKKEAAIQKMNAYNLQAGQHLTIVATLVTDRIVFITAWIEDWTTITTTTICDDYGQNGDPILINSRQDLIDFLKDPDLNKSGNVAIVVANTLDLDKKITTTTDADGKVTSTTSEPDPWSNYGETAEGGSLEGYTLKATLNMAGGKFYLNSQFLSSISSSGSIINGSFVVDNPTPIASAVAARNEGTLERIAVVTGTSGKAKASKAGLIEVNNGTIYQCSSSLPVYGETDTPYVGGIAAQSTNPSTATMAVIDGCTVTASVKGDDGVKGGGIVGLAEGRISNNTFDYGITLLQKPENFKNIIAEKTTRSLRATNNWWPTLTSNTFDTEGTATEAKNDNANTKESELYHNVLDCEEELQALLTSTYNQKTLRYKVANSFTVQSETWTYGYNHDLLSTDNDTYNAGNLYCELNGNHKTITLDGTRQVTLPATGSFVGQTRVTSSMLFSNITNKVYDLTLYLAKPLIATPGTNVSGILNSTDAIAPLAYAVTGSEASISNIQVKMDDACYVQAALPAGVVCWAYGGATVKDCQVKGNIQCWLPSTGTDETSDARHYAGGIVGCAAKASIQGCVFHSTSNTLQLAFATNANVYYGGILGGTAVKDINTKEYPAVSLIDNISWYSPAQAEVDNYHGAIVGYALYTENNVPKCGTVQEGDDTKCQGNWWNTNYRGAAAILAGETTESVIGKCSNYQPSMDHSF